MKAPERFYWATRAGTDARRAEERIAAGLGFQLVECKAGEALARGTLAGQWTRAAVDGSNSEHAEALGRLRRGAK